LFFQIHWWSFSHQWSLLFIFYFFALSFSSSRPWREGVRGRGKIAEEI